MAAGAAAIRPDTIHRDRRRRRPRTAARATCTNVAPRGPMRVRHLTRPRSLLLALCLAFVALVGDAAAAPGQQQAVRIIRPRAGSRIYVPRSRAAIRETRKAERFFKYRYGAKAYLKRS